MGLFTEVQVLKSVDMGDMQLQGQALKLGVISIYMVRIELSELMGRVGIAVQQ
jgi:hypothetical protein